LDCPTKGHIGSSHIIQFPYLDPPTSLQTIEVHQQSDHPSCFTFAPFHWRLMEPDYRDRHIESLFHLLNAHKFLLNRPLNFHQPHHGSVNRVSTTGNPANDSRILSTHETSLRAFACANWTCHTLASPFLYHTIQVRVDVVADQVSLQKFYKWT
jgi:hypothetical protein